MELFERKWNDFLKEDIDFDKVGEATRDPQKSKEIYELLLDMFPKQKELIKYHYEEDSFAELKRFLHDIEKYQLEGPSKTSNFKIDPEVKKERDRKYNQYVRGEIDTYFRKDPKDPRDVNIENYPAVLLDDDNEVIDGNHRAYIAQLQKKPLMAYKIVSKTNNHPNVEKIKSILGLNTL